MGLEKEYDIDNREAGWQVLRMYDVGGKLSSGTILTVAIKRLMF